MHTMCSQAPAVHELMPDPLQQNVWVKDPPTASVVRTNPDDPDGLPIRETFPLTDFRKLMHSALTGCTVTTYDNKEVSFSDLISNSKHRSSWDRLVVHLNSFGLDSYFLKQSKTRHQQKFSPCPGLENTEALFGGGIDCVSDQ